MYLRTIVTAYYLYYVTNKEIPLWVRLSTNKNSMTSITSGDFRESDCDTGLAITITFSNKEVE